MEVDKENINPDGEKPVVPEGPKIYTIKGKSVEKSNFLF
jgi:hypothetical protein